MVWKGLVLLKMCRVTRILTMRHSTCIMLWLEIGVRRLTAGVDVL